MLLLESQEKVSSQIRPAARHSVTRKCVPNSNVFLGLNIEQRKRLTIGVELAAKPALLLFLDEPTSG